MIVRRAVVFLALTGCAPWGWIHSPEGSTRLRAALHAWSSDAGRPVLAILLANSQMECTDPDYGDPQEQEQALLEQTYAMTREGARIVGLELFNLDTTSWIGSFPLQAEIDTDQPDEDTPRLARALYLAVYESEAMESHGLYRYYSSSDMDLIYWVDEPGTVDLEQIASGIRGSFSLQALDVSGTFKTQSCAADTDIFQQMGLLPGDDGSGGT